MLMSKNSGIIGEEKEKEKMMLYEMFWGNVAK